MIILCLLLYVLLLKCFKKLQYQVEFTESDKSKTTSLQRV